MAETKYTCKGDYNQLMKNGGELPPLLSFSEPKRTKKDSKETSLYSLLIIVSL